MGDRVMNFRSSVQTEKKDKSKGLRGGYRDRLDVGKAAATPILITMGDYEDLRPKQIEANGGKAPRKMYHTRPKHVLKMSDKLFKDGTCLQGYDGKNDCLACLQMASGEKRMNLKDTFSINVLHLAMYHQVPVVDKATKAVKRYTEDGQNHKRGDRIMNWAEIKEPRDLKKAKENAAEMLEEKSLRLYSKKYLEVGYGHLGQYSQISDLCEQHCHCGGSLSPSEFYCSECKGILCNVEESNLTIEDVVRYASERQRCGECSKLEFPNKKFVCDTCGDDGKPLSVFEVVAYVRKSGEGATTAVNCEKIVPVTDFVFADGTYLLETYEDENGDLKWAQREDGSYVFREDIEKVMTQFDFDTLHRPLENETVAQFLKCENPFVSKAVGTSRYQGYAKNAKAKGEEVVEEEEGAEVEEEEQKPPPKAKPGPQGRKPGPSIRR